MRVSLMTALALASHSGPRRVVKLAGLSSPVVMRRRMGYLWVGKPDFLQPGQKSVKQLDVHQAALGDIMSASGESQSKSCS